MGHEAEREAQERGTAKREGDGKRARQAAERRSGGGWQTKGMAEREKWAAEREECEGIRDDDRSEAKRGQEEKGRNPVRSSQAKPGQVNASRKGSAISTDETARQGVGAAQAFRHAAQASGILRGVTSVLR